MSRLARVGSRGADFSWSKPPALRLLELGYTYVVGYLSVPPASRDKNLTRDQCHSYLDVGVDVLLVYEMDAARPNKGETYGRIDGENAALLADQRGMPTDVPILSAADLNTFAANIEYHEAYMHGFGSGCYPYTMGIYGDVDILVRTVGLWKIGWVPVGAWAWSGTSKRDAIARAEAVGAHVLQDRGFHLDDLWAMDPNITINEFPTWSSHIEIPPVETPEAAVPVHVQPPSLTEDDMTQNYYVVTGAHAKFIGTPTSVRWTGPGSDRMMEAIALQLSLGNLIQVDLTGGPGAFAATFLDGDLPAGDSLHVWSPDDFCNGDAIRARAAGVPAANTADQEARDMIGFLRADVDALQAELDATQAKLRAAGE